MLNRQIMEEEAPENFVCPISRECMWDPVVVLHNDFAYTFDDVSLQTHLKTDRRDYNPLTNVPGFEIAALDACHDSALRKQIQASQWAPGPSEAVVLDDDRGGVPGEPAAFFELPLVQTVMTTGCDLFSFPDFLDLLMGNVRRVGEIRINLAETWLEPLVPDAEDEFLSLVVFR